MPKILFIAAHRPNRSPSQRYRFEQYFDFLNQNGYECTLSYIIDKKADAILYRPGNFLYKLFITLKSIATRLKDVRHANNFDIVFIQREAFLTGSTYFEKAFSKSKGKLVFDFDDSIWLLDTSEANKKWAWLKSAKKTKRIIAMSDLVIAGNDYLAEYAKPFNNTVKVIPTTVDTDFFVRKSEYIKKDKVCIGWSGSITTIKHFEQALPFLLKIKAKYGEKVCFTVMGDESYSNAELDINSIAWSADSEVTEISNFDIGIMPLPDDEWVKGKCGLKGLTYMALEVPTVMSAVGVNPTIIEDGKNGFLAASEEEWIDKLSLLVESFDLRRRIGMEGRKTVVERFSKQSQKEAYLKSFNKLLNR